jgi:hypothetical protein
MNETELRQLFKNSSDCYADTWMDIGTDMLQGEVIQAMTENRFIEVLRQAKTTLPSKPDTPSWVGGDSIPDESSWFMCVADGVKQPMRFNRHNLFWMDLAGKTYKPGEIEKWLDA